MSESNRANIWRVTAIGVVVTAVGRSNVLKVVVALLLIVGFLPGCRSMTGRSVGRVIDDTTVTAHVKSKLLADKAANLTRIGVSTVNGVVHLDGAVDGVQDKVHAEELARTVEGVTTPLSAQLLGPG